MAVDLSEYTGTLRREVTPPGSELFADVAEQEWLDRLVDTFWDARLDGYFRDHTVDEGGMVEPIDPDGEEFSRELVALLVLYAGIKIVRNRIATLNTTFRAQAGPVEFEIQNSAQVLREMLLELRATKKALQDAINEQAFVATRVSLVDAYATRMLSPTAYGSHVAGVLAELS